jgi:hypothetical protein
VWVSIRSHDRRGKLLFGPRVEHLQRDDRASRKPESLDVVCRCAYVIPPVDHWRTDDDLEASRNQS